MKKFIYLALILLVPFAANSQFTKLIAPLGRYDTRDTGYGTHFDSLAYGSLHTYRLLSSRNSIPWAIRRPGMEANVAYGSDSIVKYMLGPDLVTWYRIYNMTAAGGSLLPAFIPGSVPFAGTGGTLTQDNSNFYWDNANKKLTVGNTANEALLVRGNAQVQGNLGLANGASVYNISNAGYPSMTFGSSTLAIQKNVSDANPIMTLRNLNGAGGNTGDILQLLTAGNITAWKASRDGLITQAPVITPGAPNTFAPALYINADYARSGPVTIVFPTNTVDGVPGTYTGISPSSLTGAGSGLVVTAVVANNLAASFTVTSGGSNYRNADLITIPRSALGSPTAGNYVIRIGNVSNANTFASNNAPLNIDAYYQALGTQGDFTPLTVWRVKDRQGGAPVGDLAVGLYGNSSSSYVWSFLSSGVTSLQFGGGSVFSPNIGTQQLTVTGSTTSPAYNTGTGFNSGYIYSEGGTSQLQSGSYLSQKIIPGGVIATYTISNAGSGYIPGTYSGLSVTGGSGSGATVNITVSAGGVVTAIVNPNTNSSSGSGYLQGETISVSGIPGGSGFTATVILRTNTVFDGFTNSSVFQGNPTSLFYGIRSIPTINTTVPATGPVIGVYHKATIVNLNGRRHLGLDIENGTSILNDSLFTPNLPAANTNKDTIFHVQDISGSVAKINKTQVAPMLGLLAGSALSGSADYIPTFTGSNGLQQKAGLKYVQNGSFYLVKQFGASAEPTGSIYRGFPIGTSSGYYTLGGGFHAQAPFDSSYTSVNGGNIEVNGRGGVNGYVRINSAATSTGKSFLAMGRTDNGNDHMHLIDSLTLFIVRGARNGNLAPGIDLLRFETTDTSIALPNARFGRIGDGDTSFLVINESSKKVRKIGYSFIKSDLSTDFVNRSTPQSIGGDKSFLGTTTFGQTGFFVPYISGGGTTTYITKTDNVNTNNSCPRIDGKLAVESQVRDSAIKYSLPGIQVLNSTATVYPSLDRTEMFYRISAAAGNVDITINTTGLPSGYKLSVLRTDGSGNTCTVAFSSGNINGSSSLSLPSIWSKAQIIYDTSDGYIVAN